MRIGVYLRKKTFLDKEKASSFECGFDPYLLTRSSFSLRFFKLCIIFLIFDIEIVLVLPLPALRHLLNNPLLISRRTIILIILIGLIYE